MPEDAEAPEGKPLPALPAREHAGWMDRVDRALLGAERTVRRHAGKALRTAWAGGWLALAVLALGVAATVLMALPGEVAACLEGFYTAYMTDRLWGVGAAVVALGVATFEVASLGAIASFCSSVGLSALAQEETALLPARVAFDHATHERVELRDRPGILLHASMAPEGLEPGERLELVARLRLADGTYVPATLPAFQGETGEAQFRQQAPAHDPAAPFLEAAVFLPLRALDPHSLDPDPVGEVAATLEVLAFSSGIFQDQLDHPVTFSVDDVLPPVLAMATETELQVLAEEVATDAAATCCGVCGDDLGAAPVHCAHCETPHHAECWEFLGRCSTFACDGTETATPGGGATRALVPLPRQRGEVRRRSPPKVPVLAGPPWKIVCDGCGDVVAVSHAGGCPGCGAPLVDRDAAPTVPPTPPSLLENPGFAYPLAAAVVLAPLAAITALAVVAPGALAGAFLGVAALLALNPRGLLRLARLPAVTAGRLIGRVLPGEGSRAYSELLEIRSVVALDEALFEGGGLNLRVRFLVKGLARRRIETVLRLRGPDGRYLEAADDALRGLYGEARVRHLGDPLTTGQPACHEVVFGLPEPPARLPRGLRETTLVAEVLCACDGEVLAELDHPFPFAPRPEVFREQAAAREVRSRDRILLPARDAPGAGTERCPACGDPLEAYGMSCLRCTHQAHQECWDFMEGCRSCGGTEGIGSTQAPGARRRASPEAEDGAA